MAISKALRNLRRPCLRDLYPTSVISSSYRVPTIIEFHGTGVRETEKFKKTSYSLLRLCNKHTYFAG
ncbi:MAG: hypothetical protein QXH10_10675 [Ignisphaera sp.]